MSRTFKTDYQALSSFDEDTCNDDEQDVPPSHNVVEIRPDQSRGQLAKRGVSALAAEYVIQGGPKKPDLFER